MSSGAHRASDASATSRNNVPRAPPLPAPRPFPGVIRNAALKIIGLPARPPSPQGSRAEIKAALGSLHRFAALGATQDATASHRTGLEINTLAINDKGTHALIGGKEIFKTVKIENGVCIEDRNLRTTIRSTPTQASGEVRKVYSIDIADVAWARSEFGDYVAAATTSGKIILYDLDHASLQGTLLHEHARQVHKVTFNPHRGNLLLSGSQDGTVRLWDIRDARTYVSTLHSRSKFSGAGDGVRDVKWSPTDGVDFASSTDSGWIQRWDIRNLKLPKFRIPAHQSVCTSIDWHPDGKHLVSAGMDKILRIWDFSSTRKHKPAWEVRTPYPVTNARWRPSCESSMPGDDGARMCTQIVTAYDQHHPMVHIWDLRRTALPFRELQPQATSPTDLLWHSQDLLWSVGREGVFVQTDIHHTVKVIDRRNLQALAIAATGETSFSIQRRHQPRKTRHTSLPKLQTPKTPSMSQSPEYSLLSRSWADESLDHSFLTVQPRAGQPRTSTRYSSATATPPSGLPPKTILKLDDILLHRQSFAPKQSGFQGMSPLELRSSAFKAMARAYTLALSSPSTLTSLPEHIQTVLLQHKLAAKGQGKDQLAQTWDIVAFVATCHIQKRLQAYNASDKGKREVAIDLPRAIKAVLQRSRSPGTTPAISPESMRPVSSIAQALASTGGGSNVTTPLARPLPNSRLTGPSHLHTVLPDPDTAQDIPPLPPSLTRQHMNHDNLHIDIKSTQPTRDQLTQENLLAMQSQRTTPMPIDYTTNHNWTQPFLQADQPPYNPPVRPSLLKHDSDESFSFLVGSASSRNASGPASYDDSDGQPASMVKEHLTRPLLRVNSQSPVDIDGGQIESADQHSPLQQMSPLANQSDPGDSSAVQTIHQSVTLDKQAPLRSELVDLRASASLDVETGEAFKLADMLQELVKYYTNNAPSAQTAAQLMIMLVPLLPRGMPATQGAVEAVMAAYVDALPGTTDIVAVLDSAFHSILEAGLNPLQIESILSTYHEQLLARRLFVEAAHLRRLAYPAFPAVYDYGLGVDNLVLSCGACRKSVGMSNGQMQCVSCSTKQSPCAVCFSTGSPFSTDMGGNLIIACLVCNHNLHAGCAGEWFENQNGRGCPTEGCLCSCVA